MKTSNTMPQYDAKKFLGITNPALLAQIVYSGIELNLFDRLTSPKTAKMLSNETGYDERNLELILNALTATNYIEKTGDTFMNLPDTEYYLNSNSEMYLGDHILYWRDMTSLADLTNLVQYGPGQKNFSDKNGSDFFDFRAMGQGARNNMYTGRVQSFISTVKTLFDKDQHIKVLDMGGGSGILSVEIAENFENAKIIVFDQPFVTEITRQVIDEYGVSDQVKTCDGNFIKDDIGNNYDFIIASGVMDFVGDLSIMAKKLYEALNNSGVLYVSTHGINESFTGPAPFILGWLSSHLNGLDILKADPAIRRALNEAGFEESHSGSDGPGTILKKK